MVITYEMAYVEVLAVLKNYLSDEELRKIPKEKIDFFERNKDKNYIFEFNKNWPIEKQNLSEKTNCILVILYRDYFADEHQKQLLKQILEINDKIIGKNKNVNREELNILFEKNNEKYFIDKNDKVEEKILIEVKEDKWYKKILAFLKRIIKSKN